MFHELIFALNGYAGDVFQFDGKKFYVSLLYLSHTDDTAIGIGISNFGVTFGQLKCLSFNMCITDSDGLRPQVPASPFLRTHCSE